MSKFGKVRLEKTGTIYSILDNNGMNKDCREK